MKYFYNIPVSVDSLINDISSIPRLPSDKTHWTIRVDPKLILKPEIYTKLSELGDLAGYVFESMPKIDKGDIHVDMVYDREDPTIAGFNILLEGQGIMKWFDPKQPGIITRNNNLRISSKRWFGNYGEPVEVWDTGKVALVRTEVPHQTWNDCNTNRLLLTIRWSDRKTWEETVEWFLRNF